MSWRATQIVPKTDYANRRMPMHSILSVLLVGFLLLSFLPTTTAQWFALPNFTESRAVLPTPDGGFITAGRQGAPAVGMEDDAYLTKLDPDGAVQWENPYGGNDAENIVALTTNSQGQHGFTGFTNSFDVNGTDADVFVGLVAPDGDLLWQRSLGGMRSDRGNGIATTADGGLIVTGCWDCFGQSDLYLLKLDASGNVEWSFHNYNLSNTAEGFSVVPTADGGYAVTGWIDQSGNKMLFLLKTDANGQELWQKVYGGLGDDIGQSLIEAANGDLLVAGYSFSNNFTSEDVYLIRTDSDGEYLWHQYFGETNTGDFAFAVEELPNGEILVAGSTWSFGAINGDVYLIKTDAGGNEVWSRTYGTTHEETGRSIAFTEQGDLLVAGIDRIFEMGVMVASTGLVIRADAQGMIMDNFVRGNVYHDLSGDCAFQMGETALESWIVQLSGNGERYYATTDAQGDYEFRVSPGDYELELLPPTYNWESCLPPLDIMVQGPQDTLNFELPAQSTIIGSYLEVDVSTAGLTTCSNPTYYINYCNKGPQLASAAMIRVDLDQYFTYLSSTINGTSSNGRSYEFMLGDIDPWECGRFAVEVAVDCGAPEGLTHCLEAHALPNAIDLPIDPQWDRSSLQIESSCVQDTTLFTVRNVGAGDMDNPQYYIVIEDDLVLFTGPIDLEIGEAEVIKYVPKGKTHRMEIAQSPGHPGRSHPSSSLEACGMGDNGEISLGYVTQFPEDDADFFVSIDCQENSPAFAPFEKKAYPKGTEAEHFIDANTDLEYHLRFQNTLQDTVASIVIRDTLSPFLDLSTIIPGASSHPYRYELYGNGIIKFTFDAIHLPPAADHPTTSVGFVKFRVSQLMDNPPGTQIVNGSTIYYDLEPPLQSPEVFHTIREEVVYAPAAVDLCLGDVFGGETYTESTYVYDTVNVNTYDSITITQLTVNPLFTAAIDTSICEGEVYEIGAFQYTEAGEYEAKFIDQNGCDSVYQIHLEVLESPIISIPEEICAGDSLIFNGNIYTSSGEYITLLTASNGCDSSVHLLLTVLDSILTSVDTFLYVGAVYNGVLISGDTSFVEEYTAINGCDSLVNVSVFALTTGDRPVEESLKGLTIFPNPVRAEINLRYFLEERTSLSIELYTPWGSRQALFSEVRKERGWHEHRFSLAEYPSGAYLLRIRTSRGQQIRKVIKWD